MKHIKARVKEAGAWMDLHSVENVDAMYQVVASIFGPKGASHNARATQARWSTFLNQVRKKLQKEREEAEAQAAQAREEEEEAAREEEESEKELEEEWDEGDEMEESEEESI
jgi:Skp family chaperone for outer membrane proteins